MGAHQLAPRHGGGCVNQAHALVNEGAVGKGEIDPPTEEEKRDGHQRDQHRVLHQRVHHILVSRGAHLVHAKPDMDQEHQSYGKPVVEFREDDRQGADVVIHVYPRCSVAYASGCPGLTVSGRNPRDEIRERHPMSS
jgi:hypothetical protein